MTTESESLFEKLCNAKNVQYEPIPRAENLRTPDYRIWLNSTEVITEVKQIEWNKGDLHFLESVRKGDKVPNGFRATGHLRIRKIIDDAYPQLRNFVKGLHPSIIVVCDLTKGLSNLDYEDILNAMYGDEIVIVDNFSNDLEEVAPARHRFGGHRKVTKASNRSLSAMALLQFEESTNAIGLTIFHNIHAEVQLNPQIAWPIADKQYTLQYDSEWYQYWTEIMR